MFLKDLRVGFVPYMNLHHPWNLRNFIYYSRKRNLQFEIFKPENNYDVIILSPLADISFWARYPKGKEKIIFFLFWNLCTTCTKSVL